MGWSLIADIVFSMKIETIKTNEELWTILREHVPRHNSYEIKIGETYKELLKEEDEEEDEEDKEERATKKSKTEESDVKSENPSPEDLKPLQKWIGIHYYVSDYKGYGGTHECPIPIQQMHSIEEIFKQPFSMDVHLKMN